MTPRIAVDDVSTDFHGALDVRAMEPADVHAATDVYDAALRAMSSVDVVTMEVARLRNALEQQCHL